MKIIRRAKYKNIRCKCGTIIVVEDSDIKWNISSPGKPIIICPICGRYIKVKFCKGDDIFY